MKHSIYLVALLCGVLMMSCALGDGRGFATVDGSLSVTMANGESPDLDELKVTISALKLDGVTVTEGYGKEEVTSILPVGLVWTPLDGATPASFGPVEVDRGPYSTISVVISKIAVKGQLDGNPFSLVVAPEDGIVISAEADLPVNGDELPLISISGVVTLPNSVLEKVVASKGAEAAAEQIAQNLQSGSIFAATWIRRAD